MKAYPALLIPGPAESIGFSDASEKRCPVPTLLRRVQFFWLRAEGSCCLLCLAAMACLFRLCGHLGQLGRAWTADAHRLPLTQFGLALLFGKGKEGVPVPVHLDAAQQ